MLLSGSAEPNNVPVLTERPGKTGSAASRIVCATQWQPATQAHKGGFESWMLCVAERRSQSNDCLCALQMFEGDSIFGSASSDAISRTAGLGGSRHVVKVPVLVTVTR